MRIDNAAVISSLAPAPSMSRTGKMADMAMSTASLARSSAQSFTVTKKKQPRLGVIVAEVVDASLLDPFGTSNPKADIGRSTELLSSPREHPQLVSKYTTLKNTEKQIAFKKSVDPAQEKEGNTGLDLSREQAAQERLETHRQMFQMDDGDDTSSNGLSSTTSQNGSSCFRAVPRTFRPHNLDVPPIGHYRPRFTVVEQSAPAHGISKSKRLIESREREKSPARVSKRKAEFDAQMEEFLSASQANAFGSPRSGGRGNSDVALNASLAGPLTEEPGSPQSPSKMVPMAQKAAAPTNQGNQMCLMDHKRMISASQGSSMFTSNTPNRMEHYNDPYTDQIYYPYNEDYIRERTTKHGVDFATQIDREKRMIVRGASNIGHGPDVMYNAKDHDAWRSRSHVGFHSTFPRVQGGGRMEAGSTVAPRPVDGVSYRTEHHYKKQNRAIPFDKTPGRDAKFLTNPGSASRFDYTPNDTERTAKNHRTPLAKFDKSVGRNKSLMDTQIHDLDYEVSHDYTTRRCKSVNLDHSRSHGDLWIPSITSKCNYSPREEAVRPRSVCAIDFNHSLSRASPVIARSGSPSGNLDRFYEADSPTTKKRTVGDPMLRSHMSREQRNVAMAQSKISPDTFYDYDWDKIKPHSHSHGIDFSKGLSRSHKMGSRSPQNESMTADQSLDSTQMRQRMRDTTGSGPRRMASL